MHIKIEGILAAFGFIAILFAVATKPNLDSAQDLMSKIKRGMTFDQIAEIVPLDARHELAIQENGGIFFDVPIDWSYIIQLRFEHPVNDQSVRDTRINYSPRLRNRYTKEFIAGDEASWPTDD